MKSKNASQKEKIYCVQRIFDHWAELNKHCNSFVDSQHSVYHAELKALMQSEYADPDMYIRSLTASKQRTLLLVAHIETQLRIWMAEKRRLNTYAARVKRRLIHGRHFAPQQQTLWALARAERKPLKVVERYYMEAINELTAMIFGADGLLKIDGAVYVHTLEETLSSGGHTAYEEHGVAPWCQL